MKKSIKYLLALILVSFIFSVNAQDVANSVDLKLRSKSYDDRIVLRWAYAELGNWRHVNEEGFRLERITLDSKTNIPESDNYTLLADNIKPWTREEFKAQLSMEDTMAIAAYGLLYDSLALKYPENLLYSLKEKSNDERRRAAFAMFIADQNAHAATTLGLRYEDTDVQEGKKYVYRLSINNKYDIIQAKTVNTIVKKTKERIYSAPVPPKVFQEDGFLAIRWSPHPIFGQWHIERSEDGKNFKRINKAVIIPNDANPFTKDSIGYVDQNLPNYKVFFYRIVGIDIFGDLSAPSMSIPGLAKDKTAPNIPTLKKADNTDNLNVALSWDYIPTPDLEGFLVLHSNSPDGKFLSLNNKALSPSARNYTHRNANEFEANVYKILAIDKEGNIAESFPLHAIIKNQAPPDAPENLKGNIDSNGVVSIEWNSSKAMDVKGYVVYKANADHHRFIALNGNKMVKRTNFLDTISLNVLTEKIYYKVQAVDMHYAHSVDSKTLILSKPDTVAPVSPVIDDYKVNEEHIYIHWRPSSSDDAVSQTLLKTPEGKETQEIPLKLSQTEYMDKDFDSKEKIQYQLIAQDDAGNYSLPSSPVILKALPRIAEDAITNLDIEYDSSARAIKLSWNITTENSQRLVVLRSEEDGKSRVLKHLSPDKNSYVDNSIKQGKNYKYSIALYYKDGGKSVHHHNTTMNIPN